MSVGDGLPYKKRTREAADWERGNTILVAKACNKHRGEGGEISRGEEASSLFVCLFVSLLSSPLLSHTALCFPLFEAAHWRIEESALEFHPLYCKEDLVLLNTSCRLFFFSQACNS